MANGTPLGTYGYMDLLPHTFIKTQTIDTITNQVIAERRYDNPSDKIITISIDVNWFVNPTNVQFKLEQYNL